MELQDKIEWLAFRRKLSQLGVTRIRRSGYKFNPESRWCIDHYGWYGDVHVIIQTHKMLDNGYPGWCDVVSHRTAVYPMIKLEYDKDTGVVSAQFNLLGRRYEA